MTLIKDLSRKLSLKKETTARLTPGNVSYAQCGEDLIVSFLFESLKIGDVRYLDIGAYHPFRFSNTYLFYEQGHSGVCIEPDPSLFTGFQKARGRDVCLNIGVGIATSEVQRVDFYLMTHSTLNTFSREDAERYQSYGTSKIEDVIQVPILTVNEIIEKYFSSWPNFVSLDIEGMDFEVIRTFDFSSYRPTVFCVETLTYTEDNTERKLNEIIEFMITQGYFVWADTYINTIFVDRATWNMRRQNSLGGLSVNTAAIN